MSVVSSLRKSKKSSLILIGILSLGLILLVLLTLRQQIFLSRAATNTLEAESATLAGTVTRQSDSQAAGGSYLQFGAQSNPTPTPTPTPAVSPPIGTVDASTMNRKFMLGYQGWFQCPTDGSPSSAWRHWFGGTPPTSPHIDAWPDMSEFGSLPKCDTGLKIPNGQPAYAFSAYHPSTVLKHFQWMQQYGMDGVWLQRFNSELSTSYMFTFRNQVALNVKSGAESTGRVYGIMYDISGLSGSVSQSIINDWKYMVDTLKITQSSRYIKQDGLPVVTIWGFGFSDRPGTPSDLQAVLNFFHSDPNPAYRAYVMGGVNNDWRTNSTWANTFKGYDAISPWMVGRINSLSGADNYKSIWTAEVNQARTNGQMYVPVIFPGFSFRNGGGGTLNQIPRLGGNFLWRQAYNLQSVGATTLYGAMFDEVNEGTAFFKMTPTAATAPTGISLVHVNADGFTQLPSDWYLQVAGDITKMIKGQIPLSSTMVRIPR